MEAFGANERNFTHQEKQAIIQFMKTDHRVPYKLVESLQQAERESEHFRRGACFMGPLLGGAAYFLPVIKSQTAYRRAICAAIPGYLAYTIMDGVADSLLWTKAYWNFQKFQAHHGLHNKVFI